MFPSQASQWCAIERQYMSYNTKHETKWNQGRAVKKFICALYFLVKEINQRNDKYLIGKKVCKQISSAVSLVMQEGRPMVD